jgi:hypothetical protein
MQLSADQIVEETSDWPEDAVADLVDRILRAKYGEVDPSVDKAWQDETLRRIAYMESGRVQGIPLDETLAKAPVFAGVCQDSDPERSYAQLKSRRSTHR